MSFTEKTLRCLDCGGSFAFTAGEQKLFASKGYTNDPKFCSMCRAAKRIARGDTGSNSMGCQGARRQMFVATCTSCRKDTQIPFEPRNGRPVYCNTCYSKVRH